jgi:HEAT repeat protein
VEDWRLQRDRALLLLESAPRRERHEAVEVLCDLAAEDVSRSNELAEVLPRLLKDDDEGVRRGGLKLGALVLDSEDAQALFISHLKDSSELVRLEGTGQLADLISPTSRGALAAMMEDESFLVRFEAARGMAQLQHSSGMETLIEALEDPQLRFRALGALAILGDSKATPAIRRVFDRWLLPAFDRTQAAGVLAKLGDTKAAEHLIARTKKSWGPDRALAVELCGEISAPGAFERLSDILQNPKDGCRGAAARGLGRLKDQRAGVLLANALSAPSADDDFRLVTAEARQELEQILEAYG